MIHTRKISLFLILIGLIGTLLSIAGYGFHNTPLTPEQPEFVTGLLLIISIGFFVTGWYWRQALDSGTQHYRRLPALTVGIVGFYSMVGSVLIFQPWTSRGFARLFLSVLTGGLSLLGALLVVGSLGWYRQQTVRTPLAFLMAILSIGLFHRYAQTFDPIIPVPVVALIVVIVGIVPFLGVWYAIPSE